jgi:hypothetical protein
MPQKIDNPVVPVSVTVTKKVHVEGLQTLLAFNLDTRGYRFRTIDAIELDEPDADFPYPSWTVTPRLVTLVDLCNTQDVFKYTVHVINTITDEEHSVDPEIKNGDGSGA